MKKLLSAAAVAFLLFYVLTQPTSAAHGVRSGVVIVGNAFGALLTFFTALVH